MAQPVFYRAHPTKRLLDVIVVAPGDALIDQREHLPHQRVLQLQFPDPAVQCLHVTVIARESSRRGLDGAPPSCAVFLFPGGNAAMPPSRYAIDPMGHGAHAELPGGLLLPHAAQYQFDRLLPGFHGDDGAPHTPGMTGILRQPAFQALLGRITEMFDHFGGCH